MDPNERLTFSHPDPENVTCRSCRLAIKGKNTFDGEPYYCKTNCGHYVRCDNKPVEILMDGSKCQFKIDGVPSVNQVDVIDNVTE